MLVDVASLAEWASVLSGEVALSQARGATTNVRSSKIISNHMKSC
jgi:hypothetical protein